MADHEHAALVQPQPEPPLPPVDWDQVDRHQGVEWSIRVAIAKTKDTHTYPIDKLKLHAKDWEPEKVINTEHKLHAIRMK